MSPVNQRLINALGRSQRLQIVNELKRSEGMTVKELADALDMSYMGIKQHCIEMERAGYLDHWRRPKPQGRPEMLYRLTRRCEELFPVTNNALTLEVLEAAKRLFGAQSPDKVLFLIFQDKAEFYRSKTKADSLEQRVKWLARLRDNEGYMADMQAAGDGFVINEYNSPILELVRAWPCVRRLEEQMFESVLGVPVRREEGLNGGTYRCRFIIG